MSSNFNNAKVINVYYNKGDRKPYDVNGKPIAYIGEESIGATEATTIRFYLGEDLDSSTAVIVTKRPDGERRLDLCAKVGTGANSYYEVTLNAWYGAVKGKSTLAFKVYNGTVVFDDNENPTEITSVSGRIVVSDIFNLEIAYAPEAELIVPADDTEPYQDWFFALSTKLDKAESITVQGALPTLTGGVYDDRYFYVENEGVGKLWYIDGSTAIEVVWQVGTLRLTPTGNGEVTADTGKLSWNQPNGTVNVGLYNDVNVGVGEDVFYYVKASGAITKGDVIQYAGYQGDHSLAKRAVQSEVNANPKLIMGIAKQNITNGEFGYVAHFGKIEGIDTKGVAVNSFVWFDSAGSTAGNWTTTQPTAPNAKILLAVVIKAETSTNANNGILLVRPTIEPKLEELQNVLITSVANGNVLSYDGTKWVNSTRLTTIENSFSTYQTNIANGTTVVGRAVADQNGNTINTTYLTQSSASSTYIPLSSKGQPNGVAPLGADNKILSIHLPGGVDDVKEFADEASLPLVGEASIIYVTLDTNKAYRWGGSAYVEISASLALGETSSTAYRGDRGKTAYDHSQIITGNPHGTTATDVGAEPANANIQSHISSTSNPHGVTVGQIGAEPANANIQSHISSTSNPHSVTVGQIGAEPANANIQAHISSTTNPHSVTATQVGLGNVTNESKATMFANPTFTGIVNVADSIRGSATLTIDPATHGDATGKVIILGDLQVDGTTTTINSTTLEVDDKNIELAKGSANKGASNEAGITIDLGSDGVAEMKYFSTPDAFTFNKNVGVGTTSPLSRLHIDFDGTGNKYLLLGRETNGLQVYGSYDRHIRMTYPAVTDYDLVVGSSGQLAFVNNGTEHMRIASNGSVGIGLTSPQQKLGIDGGIGIASSSKIGAGNNYSGNSSGGFAGFGELEMYSGSTGNTTLHNFAHNIDLQTASSSRLFITQSGNVGIGTTSPSATSKLTIRDADYGNIRTENTVGGFLEVGTTANATSIGFIKSNYYLDFIANNATRMWIDGGNGNVGIGTTSPEAKFHVQNPSGNANVALFNNTTTSGNVRNIESSIQSNGNNTSSWHFIGTTQTVNSWFLYGNGTTSYSSDRRLKKNIETTRDGYLEDLMKLRVVKYNWHNSEDGSPKELGLIAQEVEEVFPGLIQEHEMKGVGVRKNIKHSVMEFIFIKSIQELKQEVESLKEELELLKAKVG